MRIFMLATAALAALLPAPAMAAGNGAPSGTHYNLNIIGVKDKNNMPDNDAGHVIFVKLWGGDTKILLQEGDYKVVDKNGTEARQSSNCRPLTQTMTESPHIRSLPGRSANPAATPT